MIELWKKSNHPFDYKQTRSVFFFIILSTVNQEPHKHNIQNKLSNKHDQLTQRNVMSMLSVEYCDRIVFAVQIRQ